MTTVHGKCKIPPQVLRSLASMNETDRKIRAQELLASYQERANKLEIIAKNMAAQWVTNQSFHLSNCAAYLALIVETGEMPGK